MRRRRWTVAEVALLLFALYSGLTYIRFLFLLAIVAAPLLAKILDFVPHYRPEADTPVINALVICLMIGSMVYYWPTNAEMQSTVAEQYPGRDSPLPESSSACRPHVELLICGAVTWN